MPTSVLIIPAFRPAEGLVSLVGSVRAASTMPIVVIDDGSGPSFRHIFEHLAAAGILVVRNAINLGKGAALKNGLNQALLAYPDAEWFVTADADGQHLPKDILAIARSSDEGVVVMGSRRFGSGVPLRSRLGNTISKYVYYCLTGIKLRDTQTGLRSIPRRVAELCLSIRSNRYEFETEQILAAKENGFRFKQVPIETVYLDGNSSSHFNPLLDSFRIYFVLLRYTLSSLTTYIADFATFIALSTNGFSIFSSNMAARAVALWLQFALLRSFVFKTNSGPVIFLAYVGYVFFSGWLSSILQGQLSPVLLHNAVLTKLVVEAPIFIFNFLFLHNVIFRDRRATCE